MGRARKIAAQIERYAAFGFVTEIEDYQKDDAAILKGIDRLYDSQRKEGLLGDPELDLYRAELRNLWSAARAQAAESRRQHREGAARALGGGRTRAEQAGMQGYMDELKVSRAKRQI